MGLVSRRTRPETASVALNPETSPALLSDTHRQTSWPQLRPLFQLIPEAQTSPLQTVDQAYHAGARGKGIRTFHRLSNRLSEDVTGAGIGLSIARNLARKHGGNLRVVPTDSDARLELALHTPPAAQAEPQP